MINHMWLFQVRTFTTIYFNPSYIWGLQWFGIEINVTRPYIRYHKYCLYLSQLLPILIKMAVIILVLTIQAEYAIAQKNDCDPSLRQIPNDPYGYRMRNDRCEGIYIKDVSTGSLRIASFTESFKDYNLSSGMPIDITWKPISANESTHLRANSLRHRTYYQMDKDVPADKIAYSWKSTILAALNLYKKDIGVVGYSSYKFGAIERRVYLPLKIGNEVSRTGAKRYELQLFPDVELTEVYVTLVKLTDDGQVDTYLKDSVPLEYGYYPAERSLKISISGLVETGIYLLEIGATLRSGGSSSTKMLFSHMNR